MIPGNIYIMRNRHKSYNIRCFKLAQISWQKYSVLFGIGNDVSFLTYSIGDMIQTDDNQMKIVRRIAIRVVHNRLNIIGYLMASRRSRLKIEMVNILATTARPERKRKRSLFIENRQQIFKKKDKHYVTSYTTSTIIITTATAIIITLLPPLPYHHSLKIPKYFKNIFICILS